MVALQERTGPAGTDWALGIEAVCAAQVADDPQAEELYREAIVRLARSPCGLDLARAQLVYGEYLRRKKRRSEARDQLRTAFQALSTMGAVGFAARAARELRALGDRARPRHATETVDALTPQELQIARLAAAGKTSKEIAFELFVSPRTVDAHLRNTFSKLQIVSRRQLRGMALHEA
jgi:DNA-binding CsgD family transcriptional regulator